MRDLQVMFQDGPSEKGAFLSRLFGLFCEEIIRIWARDSRSPYGVGETRPTVYENGKGYTLDFLFLQDGSSFVAEMKCEIQYQGYRYWRLTSPAQLDHHRNKRAFELFLQLAQDSGSVPVKAGRDVKPEGTILVWGAATAEGANAVMNHYGFSDVLTVEQCTRDLVSWENREYANFLRQRASWSSELFGCLGGESRCLSKADESSAP